MQINANHSIGTSAAQPENEGANNQAANSNLD